MKLASLVGLAAIAVAGIASATTHAWTITSTDAMKPEHAMGKHQEFVKVWTIRGSSPIESFELAAAGSVFIDHKATLTTPTDHTRTTKTTPPYLVSRTTTSLTRDVVALATVNEKIAAQIVLSGNCTKLLNEFELVERTGTLSIRFKNKNTDFHGAGYVLTQITVADKDAVTKLVSSGSSSVFVSDGVLASTGSALAISISGSADTFVTAPTTDFSLKSLALKVSGVGDIQFHAASLSVSDTLSTKISGTAKVAIVAKTIDVKQTIESKVSGGSSDIYIQADNLMAANIDTKVSGSGKITLSTNGKCVSQDISISGSGDIAAGSIRCENTKVKMSGVGTVLVQTSGTLLVPHEIFGKVQYWGVKPQHITDGRAPRTPRPHRAHPPAPSRHGWRWGWWGHDSYYDSDDDSDDGDDSDDDYYSGGDYDYERHSGFYLPKSVTAAAENKFDTYRLQDVPARKPTFLVLTIRRSRYGSNPVEDAIYSLFGYDIGSVDISGEDTQSFAVRVPGQHRPIGVVALGVFAIAAVAAVGVAVHKVVMQRRRRREYAPLLHVVTN